MQSTAMVTVPLAAALESAPAGALGTAGVDGTAVLGSGCGPGKKAKTRDYQ
jgi:hypothetical protein